MRIVKISELSDEEKKKVLQRKLENARISEQNRINANNQFNELISKNGAYDTNKHTTTLGNLKKAYNNNDTMKKSLDNYYKANKTSLLQDIQNLASGTGRVADNIGLNLKNGIMSLQQTIGRAANNTQANSIDLNQQMYEKAMLARAEKNPEEKEKITEAIEKNSGKGDKIRAESEEYYNKIQEKKNENAKIIQENTDSISNPIGKYIAGEIAPSIGQMLPGMIGGPLGTTYFIGSAAGNYYDDAKQRGMTEDQATMYSGLMGAIEGSLESLGAKLTTNVGKQLFKKNIKGALVNYGLDIGENFLEESIVEPISELVAGTTGGQDKADWSNMGKRMWESGVAGAITSAVTGGTSAVIGGVGSKVSHQNKYVDYKTNKKLDKNSQNILKQAEKIIQQNSSTNLPLQSTQTTQNSPSQQVMPMQQKMAQNGISKQVGKNYNQEKINKIAQSKPSFSEQIDQYVSKKLKSSDFLYLGKTPNVLQQIGIPNSQIIMKQNKLKTVLQESDSDTSKLHGLPIETVKKIPEAIANPLNVLQSSSDPNSVVIITDLADKQERPVIASIEIDYDGRIGNIDFLSNRLTSAYGKNNYDRFMQTEIAKGNLLYDIDEGIIKELPTSTRLQLSEGLNSSDESSSFITNSIPQNTKNVNGNTTSNYSMQESENNSGSFNLPAIKTLNPTEISNIKPSDASTTPKLSKVNYGKGNKQSSFFANVVTDSKFMNQDLRQQLSQEDNIRYYKGITNQETLEKAYNSLQEDGEKGTLNWINKDTKNIKAEDVAKGWILLKQYQDMGDYQGAVEIAKKMREMATGAGQTVQAYNILSRLTPEGMFYYAQSELSEAYNKIVEGKSQKWIEENKDKFELTPTETQFIMDTMKEVANMEDGYDRKVKLAEIQTMLKNKIPATTGQSIKAWMRISMLFNPKTQVRNILGNAVVLPVNVGGDIIAAGVDKMISKKTGVRTTGNINIKNYSKGFGKGLFESYNDFRKGVNTRNIEGNRFEVSEGKSFKDKGIGKALNRVDNILSFMLDAGDRGFYEATFTNSINNQLVLNNTTEVTQDMIDIATNEALQRTWQDNNKYTEAVLKIRNILNYANVKGYGLGDVIIPFAKTPANLTKAIVDYSPVGLAKAITLDAKAFKNSLGNGQYTPQMQHRLVQNIGKGMAGSFLYILGYALAKAGIASGEADDDKDVKNFMKNSLGISSYSIKIGDKTFTYDWAQPVATPLAIMTNYVKYSKENPDANIIDKSIKSLNIGTEQLLQQSFMESLNTVLNGNGTTLENLSQAVLDLPARAIPTLSKQIADMIDGTQRTSFEYDKPVQSAINSVVAKLPIASKSLPISRDTLGNEIKKYGGENNVFNVMFNPANVNKGQLSKAGEEIYRLYQETGETTVFPITAPYYINNKGEKITMTAEERSDYQKVTGEYTEKAIEELLSNAEYKKLSNEKKAELITDIIGDSNAKAKHDILNIETEDAKKKRELIEKIDTKNYYDYRLKTKDIEGKNATRQKNEVLLNANYSNKVKAILYTNTTGKEDNLYNILSTGNININEYLDYKIRDSKDEFSADKNSNGETISGSSKKKVYNYVNKNITGVGNRLIILGSQYKLKDNERKALAEYINKIVPKSSDRIEIYKKLNKNYVVKDGKVYYK